MFHVPIKYLTAMAKLASGHLVKHRFFTVFKSLNLVFVSESIQQLLLWL